MSRDELKAGRELDALVHRDVMGIVWDEKRCRVCGWPLASTRDDGCVPDSCSYRAEGGFHGRADEPPCYSVNDALALHVVEQMRPDWTCDIRASHEGYSASFDNFSQTFEASSRESLAEAVCLAALAAMQNEPTPATIGKP